MKRLFQKFIIVMIFPLGIFSCSDDDKTVGENKTDNGKSGITTHDAFDRDVVKTAIGKSNSEMQDEIMKGDSSAVAAHYTSDAKLLGAGFPAITGADGIKSMWGGMIRMGFNLKFDIVDIWGTNDLAIEEGTYRVSDKSGKEVDKGKYLVLWKQEDKKWKMFRDIWNSDAPANVAN